jgi:hypothetical protein
MTETEGIYVYGVARAEDDLSELGPRREDVPEVRVIELNGLAALVTDAGPDDEASMRESLMAHARVLERAAATATVLPMRFGMVFPDDEAVVRDLLEARHDDLVALLDRFDGHVQMTLKVNYREDAFLRELMSANPEIERLREAIRGGSEQETYNDRVRLGELISAGVEERRQRDGGEILERLNDIAVAGLSEPPETEFMVLNAPFLIERARQQEFEDAVEEIAANRAELMTFRLLGPMPAYHFVSWEQPAWA